MTFTEAAALVQTLSPSEWEEMSAGMAGVPMPDEAPEPYLPEEWDEHYLWAREAELDFYDHFDTPRWF